MSRHPSSDAYWERARRVIPSGTQTLSKAPSQFVRGVYPKYLVRGQGARVWDADGHEYIDYPMALGAILLGHAYPAVVEAVRQQAREGTLFTLMHPLEVEVAERLCDIVPCAEMVRFVKNGSDATAAAIRIARAYTGRDRVAFCGYHGWHDWFAGTTTRAAGVPAGFASLVRPFDYNRIETLERLFAEHPGEYAAVILEQGGDEPQDHFLAKVRDLAHRHGAVFVWDEIVTGLRWAPGGAQQYYGVTPDLACFGKALGNGLPISAVMGRRDLMETLDRVFVSMTFGGDVLSLAAARAVLDEIACQPVIARVWAAGRRWMAGAREAIMRSGAPVEVGGFAPRSHFTFRDAGGFEAAEIRAFTLQECVKRGVLFGAPIFMSYGHDDVLIDRTVTVLAEVLSHVSAVVAAGTLRERLEGPLPEVVFRPAAPGQPAPGPTLPLQPVAGPGPIAAEAIQPIAPSVVRGMP